MPVSNAAKKMTPEEFLKRDQELQGEHNTRTTENNRRRLAELEQITRVTNLILPAVIRRLLADHPGCDIRLSDVRPESPQIEELDLLFYDGRIEGDVQHVKLLDEPYLLVTSAGDFPDGPVRVKLLDEAALSDRRELRVVHGFGTGKLRQAVEGLLNGHPHVATFHPADPSHGGGGVTVVELKD